MSDCYCQSIPSIKNQTEMLILQHSRERDHPFNTARMVQIALERSSLFHGTNAALGKIDFPIQQNSGLLYPSKFAKTLSELPEGEKPQQLVLIDGTWAQARTMIRDLRQLDHLPHYKLAPTQPGQYRIRLEPNDTSLSTVEAAVEALREIEPNTKGLGQLLETFHTMVQQQLDHPKVGREHYSKGPRSGRTVNVPKKLLGDANSIVVAYGEASYRDGRHDWKRSPGRDHQRPPLVWVAERLGTGESFSQTLLPGVPLTDSFLEHLQLNAQHFESAVGAETFRSRWREFLRPNDLLVVFNRGTIELIKNVSADFCPSVTLKSINFDPERRHRSLASFLTDKNLHRNSGKPFGRAGERLSGAIALVEYLRN